LACAATVHAILLAGFASSYSTRRLGEPEADSKGIAVEIVDAADLDSRNSVPVAGDTPPINTASIAPPQPQRPPQPQQPPAEAEPAPPDPAPLPSPPPPAKKTPAIEKMPDQPTATEQPKKQSPKTPPAKSAAAHTPQDPLELSLPDAAFAPSGRSAAFARPANITRSGENDEFGRGVIRALRRTMPGSDVLGQVTIRLFLNEHGNIGEVRLLRSSSNPIMDQNVVFAAKQSSFPIPPAGATVADRTFVVTYIYR
jgi:protein TonB